MTIETTHVGSLPAGMSCHPFFERQGRDLRQDQFEASVQNAINNAVKLQREAGVTIVSDGNLVRSDIRPHAER